MHNRIMDRRFFVINLAVVGGALPLAAQFENLDFEIDPGDLLKEVEAWAQDNLDEDFLRAIKNLDQADVRRFLEKVENVFHGEYALDLAELLDGARQILPLLKSTVETEPYAVWLETRLDYFEVSKLLKDTTPIPPKLPPSPPKPTRPNPSPAQQQQAWQQKLIRMPVPSPAKEPDKVTRLKEIFRSEQVPPQLVWLAEVESSFNPRAKSPVGAAGLYQLMPATAKQYGLSLWPFDERLNPDKNARVSARHLRRLNSKFRDWPLSLAAYNAGEGTVQRTMNRAGGKTFNTIAHRLPAETQMYVPKVNATLLNREQINLENLPLVALGSRFSP